MKAAVLNQIGQFPEVGNSLKPEAKDGECLVEIKAAALNRRDYWITQGQYPGIQTPIILGSDGAGICNGERVLINPGFHWGSSEDYQSSAFQVLGLPQNGTLAEYVAVPRKYIYPIPEHLSYEQAAAIPLAGVTAYRAAIVRGMVTRGKKVLITGIGGGVATMALQFALLMGAEVYVTSSSEAKREKAKQMGAKDALDYTKEGWVKELKKISGGLDVIVDGAGGDGISQLVNICNPGANIVLYGGTAGRINDLSPQRIFWKQLNIYGSTMGSDRDFEYMLDMIDLEELEPCIDRVVPIDDIQTAFKLMEDSHQFGKIVIKMNSGE